MKKTSSFLPILLIRTYAIMCLCFGGLTSVVRASPLDTIPPPITDAFIPVNQRVVEPVRNPGDFIGRVFAPKPEDWETRPEAQPITGVTVTIASGPRSGESVATNPSGYYRFPKVLGDELHLRVEKEHFEPKEVMVHRSRPTILANGDVPNYTRDPQQHPGNILIGHRWPDEVRFILEKTLVVHDLLYVEGGRLPKGTDLGGFYSLGVVVIYSYQYADWKDEVGLLGTFAHEIAHAHQHATVSVDGSAWEIHGWGDTPEGRAYEEARRKDWAEVGKSPLDNIYGGGHGGGVALTETAAETCAHYWSVDRWGGRTAYGLLEVEAPHRYRWAEKWVPISIAVRPPSKVVSIPDPNLAALIRNELGLTLNAPITKQAMQRLTQLDARNSKIKNLTGLEHATQLRLLELRENQIRDIGALANLKSLTKLIIEENAVRDISPLTNMTQLTDLLIGNNPIFDFTPLANLNQLERLSLWSVNIRDVTLLASKTKLTHLWSGRNNIRDITPLTNLTQLQLLYLPHNQISDVTPLAGLVNLETLHLQDNSIRDVSPLIGLTKLTELRIEDNPITDKSPLRTLKQQNPNLKLEYIDIEIPNSAIPDAKLAAAVRQELDLAPNAPITKQKLRELTKLTADSRGIEDLTGLEHATGLRSLSLIGNYIRDVSPLTELTKLKMLSLTDNRIIGTGPLFTLLKKNTNLKLDISIPMAEHPPMYWLTSPTFDGGTNRISSPIKLQRQRSASTPVETLWESSSPFQSNSSSQLVVDTAGGKLYWTERIGKSQSEIKSINLEGDPEVQKLLTLTHVLNGITVDSKGGKFYWTNSLGRIQSANLNGKQIKTLIKDLDELGSIAVDTEDSQLYWVEGTRIRRANLNGKNIQNVVTASSKTGRIYGLPSIAIVGHKIYWLQQENDATKYHIDNPIAQSFGFHLGGRILRADLNGSNIEELIVSEYMGNDFVVDSSGEALYYTLQSSVSPVPLHILWADLNGSDSKVAVYYESIIGGPETLGLSTSSDLIVTAPVVHVESPNRPPMYWVDAEAGTLHRLTGDKVENLLPSVQNATSLAVDTPRGILYWAEKTSNTTGKIQRANLDGSNMQLVKDLTSVPLDIALDTVGGKLYLTNSYGKIQRLNLDGSNFQSNLITDLQDPNHLVLDTARGKVYWTEQTGKATGTLRRASLDGTNIQLVKELTSAPHGIAVDAANQKLYLTNSWGKIQRLNFDGSNFQSNLITDLEAPEGVAVEAVGRKIYWTELGNIRRADLNGKNIKDVVTGLGTPTGIVLGTVPTAAPAAPRIVELPPDATVLLANYPNPFNPETWIPYQLSKSAEVTLHIYSVNGTLVRKLALGHQPAGMYQSRTRAAYWDGKNEAGEAVASGIYFYTFSAGEFTATRKMLILK